MGGDLWISPFQLPGYSLGDSKTTSAIINRAFGSSRLASLGTNSIPSPSVCSREECSLGDGEVWSSGEQCACSRLGSAAG